MKEGQVEAWGPVAQLKAQLQAEAQYEAEVKAGVNKTKLHSIIVLLKKIDHDLMEEMQDFIKGNILSPHDYKKSVILLVEEISWLVAMKQIQDELEQDYQSRLTALAIHLEQNPIGIVRSFRTILKRIRITFSKLEPSDIQLHMRLKVSFLKKLPSFNEEVKNSKKELKEEHFAHALKKTQTVKKDPWLGDYLQAQRQERRNLQPKTDLCYLYIKKDIVREVQGNSQLRKDYSWTPSQDKLIINSKGQDLETLKQAFRPIMKVKPMQVVELRFLFLLQTLPLPLNAMLSNLWMEIQLQP